MHVRPWFDEVNEQWTTVKLDELLTKLEDSPESAPHGRVPRKVQAVTVCELTDEKTNAVGVGYAFCSVKDQFNKKYGRRIAKGRALKQLRKKDK